MDLQNNVIIILQARLGSSRLPAKALLPVAGRPMVVLAANRAASTGKNVIVAIPAQKEDDLLAITLQHHQIPFVRGSKDDVLARFLTAAEGYPEDTVVVRLTADNVIPDGRLIDEILDEFSERGVAYLSCNHFSSGLPYGVSVEVTRLCFLREASSDADTDRHDREHVMPAIIRRYGQNTFSRYSALNLGLFRGTVDVFEDYISISNLFKNEPNPTFAPSLDVVRRLIGKADQPLGKEPMSYFVLGGAQFGMHYGITNRAGLQGEAEIRKMLQTAILNGVEYIDTARAYKDSEATIGNCLVGGWSDRIKIITKLAPFDNILEGASYVHVRAEVEASVFRSCANLRKSCLDVLILHRASHLIAWNGAVLEKLRELQREGIVSRLGVSVQNPEELRMALAIEDIEFVQMPFNLLDWRWNESIPLIESIKKIRPLLIHIRSTLLQGLLASKVGALWKRANVPYPDNIIDWLQSSILNSECESVVELCLRFARSFEWVDGIVLGVETEEQLKNNMQILRKGALSDSLKNVIIKTRPRLDAITLNPSMWRVG